jgi:hypothetical protein
METLGLELLKNWISKRRRYKHGGTLFLSCERSIRAAWNKANFGQRQDAQIRAYIIHAKSRGAIILSVPLRAGNYPAGGGARVRGRGERGGTGQWTENNKA